MAQETEGGPCGAAPDGTAKSRDEQARARAAAKIRFVSDPAASIESVAREYELDVHDLGDQARLEDWHGARAEEQKRLLAEIRKRNASELAAKAEKGLIGLMEDLARLRKHAVERMERRLLEAEPSLEEQDTIVSAIDKAKGTRTRIINRKRQLAADARIHGRLLEVEANVCAAILGADLGGVREGGGTAEDIASAIVIATRKMAELTAQPQMAEAN